MKGIMIIFMVGLSLTLLAWPPGATAQSAGDDDSGYIAAKFDDGFYQKIQGMIQEVPKDGDSILYTDEHYYDVIIIVDKNGGDSDTVVQANKAALVEKLQNLGAQNIMVGKILSFVTASIPLDKISELSLHEEVYKMGDGELEKISQIDNTRNIIHATSTEIQTAVGRSIDGSGVTVGVIDSEIKHNTAFGDRLLARVACSAGGTQAGCMDNGDIIDMTITGSAPHGTRVAQVLGASGLSSNNGIAPGVEMLGIFGSGSSTFPHELEYALSQGADVANLSFVFGIGTTPLYCTATGSQLNVHNLVANEAVDRGLILVNAAGNQGNDADRGFYNSIAEPGCGSNIISVGGVQSLFGLPLQTYVSSSRGPVAGIILKPEIVAPAVQLRTLATVESSTQERFSSGTSFAAPQVSAAAAMVLQTRPDMEPVEVKNALLLGAEWRGPVPCTSSQYEQNNTADDCSFGRQPDTTADANGESGLSILNNVGFGILDVAQTLEYVNTKNSTHGYVLASNIDAQTANKNYTFVVDDTTAPVKVILTWLTHTHGTLFNQATSAPVNTANLDFVITSPDNTQILAQSASQTNEFAVFTPSQTGTYTVTVSGTGIDTINQPTQNFALASTRILAQEPVEYTITAGDAQRRPGTTIYDTILTFPVDVTQDNIATLNAANTAGTITVTGASSFEFQTGPDSNSMIFSAVPNDSTREITATIPADALALDVNGESQNNMEIAFTMATQSHTPATITGTTAADFDAATATLTLELPAGADLEDAALVTLLETRASWTLANLAVTGVAISGTTVTATFSITDNTADGTATLNERVIIFDDGTYNAAFTETFAVPAPTSYDIVIASNTRTLGELTSTVRLDFPAALSSQDVETIRQAAQFTNAKTTDVTAHQTQSVNFVVTPTDPGASVTITIPAGTLQQTTNGADLPNAALVVEVPYGFESTHLSGIWTPPTAGTPQGKFQITILSGIELDAPTIASRINADPQRYMTLDNLHTPTITSGSLIITMTFNVIAPTQDGSVTFHERMLVKTNKQYTQERIVTFEGVPYDITVASSIPEKITLQFPDSIPVQDAIAALTGLSAPVTNYNLGTIVQSADTAPANSILIDITGSLADRTQDAVLTIPVDTVQRNTAFTHTIPATHHTIITDDFARTAGTTEYVIPLVFGGALTDAHITALSGAATFTGAADSRFELHQSLSSVASLTVTPQDSTSTVSVTIPADTVTIQGAEGPANELFTHSITTQSFTQFTITPTLTPDTANSAATLTFTLPASADLEAGPLEVTLENSAIWTLDNFEVPDVTVTGNDISAVFGITDTAQDGSITLAERVIVLSDNRYNAAFTEQFTGQAPATDYSITAGDAQRQTATTTYNTNLAFPAAVTADNIATLNTAITAGTITVTGALSSEFQTGPDSTSITFSAVPNDSTTTISVTIPANTLSINVNGQTVGNTELAFTMTTLSHSTYEFLPRLEIDFPNNSLRITGSYRGSVPELAIDDLKTLLGDSDTWMLDNLVVANADSTTSSRLNILFDILDNTRGGSFTLPERTLVGEDDRYNAELTRTFEYPTSFDFTVARESRSGIDYIINIQLPNTPPDAPSLNALAQSVQQALVTSGTSSAIITGAVPRTLSVTLTPDNPSQSMSVTIPAGTITQTIHGVAQIPNAVFERTIENNFTPANLQPTWTPDVENAQATLTFVLPDGWQGGDIMFLPDFVIGDSATYFTLENAQLTRPALSERTVTIVFNIPDNSQPGSVTLNRAAFVFEDGAYSPEIANTFEGIEPPADYTITAGTSQRQPGTNTYNTNLVFPEAVTADNIATLNAATITAAGASFFEFIPGPNSTSMTFSAVPSDSATEISVTIPADALDIDINSQSVGNAELAFNIRLPFEITPTITSDDAAPAVTLAFTLPSGAQLEDAQLDTALETAGNWVLANLATPTVTISGNDVTAVFAVSDATAASYIELGEGVIVLDDTRYNAELTYSTFAIDPTVTVDYKNSQMILDIALPAPVVLAPDDSAPDRIQVVNELLPGLLAGAWTLDNLQAPSAGTGNAVLPTSQFSITSDSIVITLEIIDIASPGSIVIPSHALFVGDSTYGARLSEQFGASNLPAFVVNDDTYRTPTNTPITINILDNDTVTNPTITANLPLGPAPMLVPGEEVGEYVFTPTATFSGTVTATFEIDDGQNLPITSNLSITVPGHFAAPGVDFTADYASSKAVLVITLPQNPSITAAALDALLTDSNTWVLNNLAIDDVQVFGSRLVIVNFGITDSTMGGSLELPARTILLADSTHLAGIQESINDPIMVRPNAISTSQNTAITFDILANNAGENLRVAEPLPSTENGAFVLDSATQHITFTPNPGYTGTFSVQFMVDTGAGTTQTANSVTITVTPSIIIDAEDDSEASQQASRLPAEEPIIGAQQPGRDSGSWKAYANNPTFGQSQLNDEQLVSCGYSMDNTCYDVKNYHVEYERQILSTDTTHDVTLKAFAENSIKQFQIGFGVSHIGAPVNDAEASITVDVRRDYTQASTYRIQEVTVRDTDNTIDYSPESTALELVDCMPGQSQQCLEVTLNDILFREQFHSEPFVIFVMDDISRTTANYMNDGIYIDGPSLNAAPEYDITHHAPGSAESITLTRIDKLNDLWTDESGQYIWSKNDFGTWYIVERPSVEMSSACNNVDSRSCDAFDQKMTQYTSQMEILRNSLFGSIYMIPEFDDLEEAITIYDIDGDSRELFMQENGMMWLRGQ